MASKKKNQPKKKAPNKTTAVPNLLQMKHPVANKPKPAAKHKVVPKPSAVKKEQEITKGLDAADIRKLYDFHYALQKRVDVLEGIELELEKQRGVVNASSVSTLTVPQFDVLNLLELYEHGFINRETVVRNLGAFGISLATQTLETHGIGAVIPLERIAIDHDRNADETIARILYSDGSIEIRVQDRKFETLDDFDVWMPSEKETGAEDFNVSADVLEDNGVEELNIAQGYNENHYYNPGDTVVEEKAEYEVQTHPDYENQSQKVAEVEPPRFQTID